MRKKQKHGLWLVPIVLVLALAAPASAALLPAHFVGPGVLAPDRDINVLDWELVQNSPGVFWYTLNFPTSDIGYALGGPDWNVNNGEGPSYLGKTTDGGQTWTVTQLPGTNRFARGLACSDADTCWIAGAGTPRILRTVDGGVTWTPGVIDADWTGWLWSAGWTGVEFDCLGRHQRLCEPTRPPRQLPAQQRWHPLHRRDRQ